MKEDNKRKICNKVGLSSTLEQIVFECMEQYTNERLEAERSEVRNKVIEECIELLEDKGFGVNENDDSRERYNSAQIFRLLNSLKTK